MLAKHQIKGRRDRHYMFYDELNHESIQENRELEEHFEKAIEMKSLRSGISQSTVHIRESLWERKLLCAGAGRTEH